MMRGHTKGTHTPANQAIIRNVETSICNEREEAPLEADPFSACRVDGAYWPLLAKIVALTLPRLATPERALLRLMSCVGVEAIVDCTRLVLWVRLREIERGVLG